jgi:RNase P/RNase MRP subunit p30
MMINTSDINEAKKQISHSDKPIIIQSKDPAFNRKIIEYGKFDVILNIEKSAERFSLRQKDSGLNEILSRIAAKNKIAIGIDLEEIRSLNRKEKAQRFEKIIQNIKICRKTDTKIKIFNYKSEKQAQSLLISLGASSQQAKYAITKSF